MNCYFRNVRVLFEECNEDLVSEEKKYACREYHKDGVDEAGDVKVAAANEPHFVLEVLRLSQYELSTVCLRNQRLQCSIDAKTNVKAEDVHYQISKSNSFDYCNRVLLCLNLEVKACQ